MDGDPAAMLARTVVTLFNIGSVDALRNVWHPEISVGTWDGRVARGIDEVAEAVRRLEEAQIEMEPDTMQVCGDDALVRGHMVLGEDRTRVPATWLWTFRDGLLWRSNTFVGDRSSEHLR